MRHRAIARAPTALLPLPPASAPETKKKPVVDRVPTIARLGFPSPATLDGDSGGGGSDTEVVAGWRAASEAVGGETTGWVGPVVGASRQNSLVAGASRRSSPALCPRIRVGRIERQGRGRSEDKDNRARGRLVVMGGWRGTAGAGSGRHRCCWPERRGRERKGMARGGRRSTGAERGCTLPVHETSHTLASFKNWSVEWS